MGRRKIEIKAIKDDRNRSVTFLKRKGGLFKKAHELSVLCSVDVAVFIFGQNKKLYEYSSSDMRDLVTRYTYHGGPNEHKGPSDFSGDADDNSHDEQDGTPPMTDSLEARNMATFPGHPQYQHLRHHAPSASPPVPNGATFAQSAAAAVQRSHTPQPLLGSRPTSRNDMRRIGSGLGGTPVPAPAGAAVNGYGFMPHPHTHPHPPVYHPQNAPGVHPSVPHSGQYPGPHPGPQPGPHPGPHPGPQYQYPANHPHAPHIHHQPYLDDRRSSVPPSFPPPGQPHAQTAVRPSVSPPQPRTQLPNQPVPRASPQPPPHPHVPAPPQPQTVIHTPPTIVEPKQEAQPEPREEMHPDKPPQPPLLNTEIKKLPQRKQQSIFTPIDENRSVLSQHLAAFHAEPHQKPDGTVPTRGVSLEASSAVLSKPPTSPPQRLKRAESASQIQQSKPRVSISASISAGPTSAGTPPSRPGSMRMNSGASRPRLRVEIPDEPSDGGSATAESSSPKNSTDKSSSHSTRKTDSHASNVILPPPSPSASALLSAGASGPPNPFARPVPHANNNTHIDSALPSHFLQNEFLPSPSGFYSEWGFNNRGDRNTLPSPLNFATPVHGSGPSFLRDDQTGALKRKSPESNGNGHGSEPVETSNDHKRVKVDS